MAKNYKNSKEESMMAAEPIEAYTIDAMPKIHSFDEMPCTYTDEEFKKEIASSEASEFVSDDEFKKSCFEKWGVAL